MHLLQYLWIVFEKKQYPNILLGLKLGSKSKKSFSATENKLNHIQFDFSHWNQIWK